MVDLAKCSVLVKGVVGEKGSELLDVV